MKPLLLAGLLFATITGCTQAGSGADEVPELTDAYGCGHGFYLGSEDQSVGLFLISSSGFGEFVEGGSHSLPSPEWTAELRFGDDLFSNWCDDVMEPGEPEPLVRATWQISGELDLEEIPAAGECGLAVGRLVDARAIDDEGNEVDLDDQELVNEHWGCFAG